jgi:hypothetical protein
VAWSNARIAIYRILYDIPYSLAEEEYFPLIGELALAMLTADKCRGTKSMVEFTGSDWWIWTSWSFRMAGSI